VRVGGVGGLARGNDCPPGEQVRVVFEPAFGFAEVGTQAGDLIPKSAGVVHFLEVGEFMQDEVVADGDWGLDEAPIEGDGAAAGAGAPTGALVAHGHAADGQAVQGGQLEDARGQFPRRQTPEMPLDDRTEIAGWVCDGHELAAAANQSGFAVAPRLEAQTLPAKEDLSSRRPSLGLGWPQGLPQKLPLKPGNVSLGEPFRFRERSPARNRDSGGTIRAEAEDIAPGARVTNQPEPHSPSAGDKPVVVGRGGRPGSKKPFELHSMI
jgi:hypothetical protein